MKKRIEEYIPRALEALKTSEIVKNDAFSAEFGGYIAAFGPSIRQSGLRTTVAFYSRDDSRTIGERKKVGDAIRIVIEPDQKGTLLEYVLSRSAETEEIEDKILDAVIALKLALRTFKKIDKKEERSS